MLPNRNENHAPASGQTYRSMSRWPLIPLGSYLFPQTRSLLGRPPSAPASSFPPPRLLHHLYPPVPPFYPWCTAVNLPHALRPPLFLHPPPPSPLNYRSFCSTDGRRMERPDPEREPPQKRRKSSEETHKESSGNWTNCQHLDKDVARNKASDDVQSQRRMCPQLNSWSTEERTEGKDSPNPWTWVRAEGQKTPENLRVKDGRTAEPLQRRWERAPLSRSDEPPPPGVSTGFDFTVMSYNILSQDLLLDNAYLYKHCDPEVLSWDFRLPRLLREIQDHDADILCLQEVQEDHFTEHIRPALEALGYLCEFKKRTGLKPDGCAVIFKGSRLSLLSSNPVEFFRHGDTLLDRDNVGLVVCLSPASDPASSLCIANTHLLYNPRRGDIKLAQLAILLAEIHRLARLPDGSTNPVLLCGDFNSTPWSPLYRFLTSGRLDFRGLPIGMVSGQERNSRAQRLLCSPLWSSTLGINSFCQYQEHKQIQNQVFRSRDPTCDCSTAVEGAISDLTVEDDAPDSAEEAPNRWRVSHPLKLKSSYNHRLSPDGREEVTTCHSRAAMTVDYILYTPDSPSGPSPSSSPGGQGLQLLGRLSLVSRSELEQVNNLPNQNHSSDHLPLLARFRLRPR